MWAKQSTAATLIIGPILDSTGAEYTSAVIGDLSISKNGGTLTALAAAATLTHIANGQYTLVMTTGNLDTLGRLQITCNKSTYQMPPIGLNIVPAMVFDSMVLGTDVLQGDVVQIGGDTQSATDLKDFADAGYDPATNKVQGVVLVDTCTTNSDMRGTDNAALAATALSTAVWTSTIAGRIDVAVSSRLAPLVAGRDIAVAATTGAVELDSAAILAVADQVWDEAMSGHTTAGTYGGRIVRATNSNTEVQITGSNHIAADIHNLQSGVITAADFAADSITASALATDAVTEIQSGLATAAALAAAKTILDKVDTGLVVDGAVYQFTANMLELGPSGSSTVTVLPATGIVADRSAGTTLTPVVGETISQSITVYQSDGTTAVNLSAKTLKVIFETMSGVDVAVVLAADITISGASSNVVTFAYPSAVTASERTLRFAIRDAAAPLTMYLQGVCSVIAAPKVDA